MVTQQEVDQALKDSAVWTPMVLSVKYLRDTDRIELTTSWCTLVVDRMKIEEYWELTPDDMEKICLKNDGIHIDHADIDICASGLMASMGHYLIEEADEKRI